MSMVYLKSEHGQARISLFFRIFSNKNTLTSSRFDDSTINFPIKLMGSSIPSSTGSRRFCGIVLVIPGDPLLLGFRV